MYVCMASMNYGWLSSNKSVIYRHDLTYSGRGRSKTPAVALLQQRSANLTESDARARVSSRRRWHDMKWKTNVCTYVINTSGIEKPASRSSECGRKFSAYAAPTIVTSTYIHTDVKEISLDRLYLCMYVCLHLYVCIYVCLWMRTSANSACEMDPSPFISNRRNTSSYMRFWSTAMKYEIWSMHVCMYVGSLTTATPLLRTLSIKVRSNSSTDTSCTFAFSSYAHTYIHTYTWIPYWWDTRVCIYVCMYVSMKRVPLLQRLRGREIQKRWKVSQQIIFRSEIKHTYIHTYVLTQILHTVALHEFLNSNRWTCSVMTGDMYLCMYVCMRVVIKNNMTCIHTYGTYIWYIHTY